jgi:hypothetical protein
MRSSLLGSNVGSTPAAISRRKAWQGILAVAAGSASAVHAGSSPSTAGQDATPVDRPDAIVDWIAGWQATDAVKLASAYAEDAISMNFGLGLDFAGRAAIQQSYAGFFGAFELPLGQIAHHNRSRAAENPESVYAAADHATVEWFFQGRYSGHLFGMPRGDGRSVSAWGVNVLTLDGGLIVEEHVFFNFIQSMC